MSAHIGKLLEVFFNTSILPYMNESSALLTGTPASAGVAKGKVKIVHGINDAPSFMEGSILVTKITDPTMVFMMNKAAAIVCDIGGITSHPSIVSRELGIPCVVGTKEATTKLVDGQEIIVNGTTGEIFL